MGTTDELEGQAFSKEKISLESTSFTAYAMAVGLKSVHLSFRFNSIHQELNHPGLIHAAGFYRT